MKLEFSPGELYEASDAINAALRRYLESGDPEFHEAKQGSVSNLLGAARKMHATILGGKEPPWLQEFGRRAAALRDAQRRSSSARAAVQAAQGSFDARADQDGIRDFV